MLLQIFCLLLASMLLACSPQESARDFSGRDQFKDLGPKSEDLQAFGAFSTDTNDLIQYRGVIGSQQIFNTSIDLYEALMLERKELERESHILAYSIRKEIYQIAKLEASLVSQENNISTAGKDYLVRLIKQVRELDAISLKNFRRRVDGIYRAEGFLSPIKTKQTNKEISWLKFAENLRHRRFYYGDLEQIKSELRKALPENSKEKTYGFYEDLESLLAPSSSSQNPVLEEELRYKSGLLLDRFYKEDANSMKFEVEDSTYIEAALGRYGGDVYQLWTDSFQEIKKQIKAAFKSIEIKIPRPKTKEEWLRPEKVVQRLDSELKLLVEALREQKVDERAVKQVSGQIDNLRPLIDFAIETMSSMKTTNLERNVELFSSVLERLETASLFPETVITAVKKEVEFPEDIRRQIRLMQDEKNKDKEDLRLALGQTIIVKIWRYMRAQVEREFAILYDKARQAGCVNPTELIGGLGSFGVNFGLSAEMAFADKAPSCDEYPDLEWAFQRFWFKVEQLELIFGSRALVLALFSISEKDLDYLARTSAENPTVDGAPWIGAPILETISGMIHDHIKDSGIGLFVDQIDEAVSVAFLKKVSLRLADELSNFDKIIESTILKTLSKNEFEPKEFYYHLKKVAKNEIGNKILSGSAVDEFRLFEAASVQAVFGLDEWEFRRHNPSASYFLTGSEAINTAISARILSFWANNELSSSHQESLESFGSVRKKAFELVNKSISLMGTQDYFGRMSGSLITNLNSISPKRLDIYTYQYEDEMFGVPDQAWLDPETKYFELGLIKPERSFSVANQASLLQSSTYLIEMLSDFEESPLDLELHNLDYEGVAFFPKSSLLDLGLGLASVVLRNLHKQGLLLFDVDRKLIRVTEENRDQIASKVTSAALVSMVEAKEAKEVNAAEMAKYMLSLAEFLEVTERLGLGRSNSIVYLSADSGKPVLDELEKAMELLRKLYIAMANYISSRLRGDNYLYYDSLNLKTGKRSTVQSLETQLLVNRAMLKAHKIWGAEIYLWAAVDNYFQLNKEFLDLSKGHYKSAKLWPPHLVALSHRFLKELSHEKKLSKFLDQASQARLHQLIQQQQFILSEIL